MRLLIPGCYLNCSFRWDPLIAIHFQVQQRKSLEFSPFFLWMISGLLVGFVFPPRKNFILLTPYACLSRVVKTAVVSCSGLHQEPSQRKERFVEKQLPYFSTSLSCEEALAPCSQARLLPADRAENSDL